MAQRKKAPDVEASQPPRLVEPREVVKEKIQDRINKGVELRDTPINSRQVLDEVERKQKIWNDYNYTLLSGLFNNSLIADEYSASAYYRMAFVGQYTIHDEIKDFSKDIIGKITSLESILERLDIIPELDSTIKTSDIAPVSTVPSTNDVFIVHGQDDGTKETVARFISRFDLNPIILHEQASEGRTIIEKFEGHASTVGYAVILMTPDDVGHLKDKPEQAKPRARQNVIFELGYFIGKLSRKKVCALYKEGVEIPSDYQGVIFIPMDAGGAWRFQLAKELKSAGYNIDMNLAL